jgi:uncharacterized protein
MAKAAAACQYPIRHQFVPDCVRLTPKTLPKIAYWMPRTCAYRLLHQGGTLPDWHPLLTGDPESTHRTGNSVRGMTVPEFEVPMRRIGMITSSTRSPDVLCL